MSDDTAQHYPYDVFPYTGYPHMEAHPSRVAAIARSCGLQTASVRRCRVLELACGDGANLLLLAEAFPESTFVGIDLAQSVENGRTIASSLGLQNIEFRRRDLSDLDGDLANFDYIIAEGVYSWVSAHVRDRLMEVCRRALAPRGVAYISYSTLPGSYPRLVLRDLLLFHNSVAPTEVDVVSRARSMLRVISQAGCESLSVTEIEQLLGSTDEGIYHDDLAKINEPVYLYQFLQMAASHGLQYLGDASLVDWLAPDLPARVLSEVASFAGSGNCAAMQYHDFLVSQRFRRTILCRENIKLTTSSTHVGFEETYAVMRRRLSEDKYPTQPCSGNDEALHGDAIRGALACLNVHWPEPVRTSTLVEVTISALRAGLCDRPDRELVYETLKYLWAKDVIEFHTDPPRFAREPGEKPLVSPLVRLQASRGIPLLPTRGHSVVSLKDALVRRVLLLCDGSRSRKDIASALLRQECSNLNPPPSGLPEDDESHFASLLGEVESALCELVRCRVLSAPL